jgi:hypothetical protein
LKRLANKVLKPFLDDLEKQTVEGLEKVELPPEVQEITTVYRMDGFPLNFPYTDLPTMSNLVYNTNLHTIPNPKVEFILSVRCIGYPSKMISVWVYLATLSRKD